MKNLLTTLVICCILSIGGCDRREFSQPVKPIKSNSVWTKDQLAYFAYVSESLGDKLGSGFEENYRFFAGSNSVRLCNELHSAKFLKVILFSSNSGNSTCSYYDFERNILEEFGPNTGESNSLSVNFTAIYRRGSLNFEDIIVDNKHFDEGCVSGTVFEPMYLIFELADGDSLKHGFVRAPVEDETCGLLKTYGEFYIDVRSGRVE